MKPSTNGWRSCKLESIAEKVDYGVTASATGEPLGPRFLRITDIQNGAVHWANVPYCQCSDQEARESRLEPGDIVFARTGATTGKSYLIREVPEPSVFASYLIRLRLKPGSDPRLLAYFFQTESYWAQIKQHAQGATLPGVNATKLRSLKISLPADQHDQPRIADILDEAGELRRKRAEGIRLASNLVPSVFYEVFGDPLINPKRWQVCPLHELAHVTTGNTPPTANAAYYGNDIEWIKSDNLETRLHVASRARLSLSEQGKEVARVVGPGSTLVTCIAGSLDSIGNAAMVDREVAFNQQINALTPKAGVDPFYLYVLIRMVRRAIQAMATSALKNIVNKGNLEGLRVIAPPYHVQQQFGVRFQETLEVLRKQQESEELLSDLFHALLQRAFKGEL